MTQVALAVLSVLGALTGVGLGAMLTARSQRVAWERQEAGKSLSERRTSYAAFIAAAREWRAAQLAEARATYPLGQVPEPIVQACRDADRDFLHAARAELGSPWIDLKALDRSRFSRSASPGPTS